jgi:hypothetical protein
MSQEECASISYAKTHLVNFKIIDGSQHPANEPTQIEPLHVENEIFEFVIFEPMNNNDT